MRTNTRGDLLPTAVLTGESAKVAARPTTSRRADRSSRHANLTKAPLGGVSASASSRCKCTATPAAGCGAIIAKGDISDEDEFFLGAVDTVVLEAQAVIANDTRARFAFFRRLLAVAQKAAQCGLPPETNPPVSPARSS